MEIIEEDNLCDNAAKSGEYLQNQLSAIAERHPVISNVRGKGLLTAFDFPDKTARDTFIKLGLDGKMLKALSLASNSKAWEELRSVIARRFLALLFLQRQAGADCHHKTKDQDRRRNPRHRPAEGNVIVVRSEPAIANAPDFPRDQEHRADTIIAEHFIGIGAWPIVRSSWWHGRCRARTSLRHAPR